MEKRKFYIIKCHSCGEYTPSGTFCRHCGKTTNRMVAEIEAVACPHCEKTVAIGEYCVACGKKMN